MSKPNPKDEFNNNKKLKFKRHSDCLKDVIKGSANDFSWYNNIPSLVKDVANLPYNEFLGLPIDLSGNNPTMSENVDMARPITFPGIMKLTCTPTVGLASKSNDAVNIAMQTIYAYIRSYNSGSRNYEYTDYAMYLLAVGNMFAYYSELVRLYGALRTYSISNRYYGKQLITALGYSFDELIGRLADLRTLINNFALRINTFAVPKQFNYFDRMAWLPLHLYTDANHDKAQIYALQYGTLYAFNGDKVETGSALKPINMFESGILGYDDIKRNIDTLVNAMYYNEDVGIMSGDTFKGFGSGNIRSVSLIPADMSVTPIFNEGVLAQIHHATPLGDLLIQEVDPGTTDPSVYSRAGWIVQTNNTIINQPCTTLTNVPDKFRNVKDFDNQKLLLDCGYNDPSPEFNMEATRLMGHLSVDKYIAGDLDGPEVIACGTEFVNNIKVYTWDKSNNELNEDELPVYTYCIISEDDSISDLPVYNLLRYFDWAPIMYSYQYHNVLDKPNYQAIFRVFGEVFNYSTISVTKLQAIHNVAVQSLFNIMSLMQMTKVGLNK